MRLGIRDCFCVVPPSMSKLFFTVHHLLMEWNNTHVLQPRVWKPANMRDKVQGDFFLVSRVRPVEGVSSFSIPAPFALAL